MTAKPPLLPSDYYLLQALADAGVSISQDDWRAFKAEVKKRAIEGPQPAVVNGLETLVIISIAATVISVGLTIAASFFKPKAPKPAKVEANQLRGETVENQRRYAPRAGFDAVQDPATIGTVIPVVYALREAFGGGTYGGVRVNMPLLWSQIQSYGGSQLLRAIFLISEGPVNSLDIGNFAIGDNTIGGYDFLLDNANQLGSRLTVYYRAAGGRIHSADRVVGRSANADQGNAENFGGQDVFAVQRSTDWSQDFCSARKPSTQTTFGIYSLLGNNLGFRINPTLRPTVNAQLVPKGDRGDAKVVCQIDEVAASQRLKQRAIFSTRSGLISGSVNSAGNEITYRLDRTSDANTIFSNALKPKNWQVEITYNGSNGFKFLDSISNSLAQSWMSVDPIQVDLANEKLTTTARFDVEAALPVLEERIPRDGEYVLEYILKFTNDEAEDAEKIRENFNVRFDRNTTRTTIDTSAEYTAPQLIDNGNGSYSLTEGSFTPGSTTRVDSTTYEFRRTEKDISVDFISEVPGQEKCGDVASAVSSKQKAWDDAITVGDLYKIGSALAVCTSRNPEDKLFESEADFLPFEEGNGRTINATFTTISPGQVELTSVDDLRVNGDDLQQPDRYTATNHPHVYRIAIASISTTRACRTVELGIRSALGTRIGGLCNFADSLTYQEINQRACKNMEGKTIKRGTLLKVDTFQSGVISSGVERYSFFRISYREAGSSNAFTTLSPCFGVRSITQQACYNSLRLLMPDIRQWEYRIEPLSGWEIRSGVASGNLEVIDSKLDSVRSVSSGGVTIVFNGIEVSRTRSTFAINVTRRPSNDGLGIGFTDGDSYVDAWGKLAEAFVYEEIQSSALNGPEHEVIYVNEVVPNESVPSYGDLSIVGLNIRSSLEFQQFSQFSAYVTGGISCRRLRSNLSLGPSHLFPDVLLDLLTNNRYGKGDLVTDEFIDFDSFREAADWCASRGYFFDGALLGRQNLRQWAADVAATHLLMFGEASGKFFLRPAFALDAAPIKALFTAGNIREGSFTMQYLEAEERQEIQASVKYREERAMTNLSNPGLFPVEREILVREASASDTAPIESIDLSDYATNADHAIDAAKYIIRMRRLTTHVIRFETTYEGVMTGLAPMDYIKVAMDSNVYDEFNNGVVTPTGGLLSTKPLANGTYDAIIWNGNNSQEPFDGTLTVTNSGANASPAGVVFTIKQASRQVNTYQVESIEATDSGYLAVEAVHMPTNNAGVLRLAAGFDTNSNWVIQR